MLTILNLELKTYCNNSQGKATHATTGRAIKGLRERLTGIRRSNKKQFIRVKGVKCLLELL